jgi:hypothetical protein
MTRRRFASLAALTFSALTLAQSAPAESVDFSPPKSKETGHDTSKMTLAQIEAALREAEQEACLTGHHRGKQALSQYQTAKTRIAYLGEAWTAREAWLA